MIKKYFITFFSLIISLTIILFSANYSEPGIIFPIHSSYSISSYFGYRSLGTNHMHNGIDIPKPIGTPVYPISSGIISHIDFSSSYGHYIIITYSNSYKTLYGHLSGEYPYTVGTPVNSNCIIGYIGPKYLSNGKSNGFTTGPHLHLTIYKNNKVVDPLTVPFQFIN